VTTPTTTDRPVADLRTARRRGWVRWLLAYPWTVAWVAVVVIAAVVAR